ncbi:complex I intermediate-associated protein 30-domain-containing protein [Lentinula lateritia]|nr:complex I intermediate-associated protein 30-domain-containing protein [Lentinula lateritia]
MQSWRQIYWTRTRKQVVDGLSDILKMTGADPPSRAPHTLFTFNSQDDLRMYATGCDADIGGNSTVNLDLDEACTAHTRPSARFWGDMRLDVRPQYQGRVRGGYAAFRNKPRPTLFGALLDNTEFHEYLALRLRVSGDPATHAAYFVNLQTNGPISTDVWQHRVFFTKSDEWEDVFIPFRNFVRTNNGDLSEIQLEMSPHLRSVGISLLGANTGVSGRYQLNIDNIRVVNEEDAVSEFDSNTHEKEGGSQSWEDIKI